MPKVRNRSKVTLKANPTFGLPAMAPGDECACAQAETLVNVDTRYELVKPKTKGTGKTGKDGDK